ncbi:hypothetical protein SOM61_01565 [Massilia sp. CFBP9012]|uniref:hypothetical protein n=1 Tax=Massilia sp. CFBP9012 TaxID=3096531 RepID=UPI002A6B8AC0|nr:hypothetical protein [Massilia sp. CFBP9012]MDY0973634.1 hypothetical protein [Massilia sp. CFBP9012]
MKIAYIVIAAVLAGCASKPLPPDWQANAKGALDASVDDYLKGHTAASESEFREARRETTATGRPDRVAQVELVRCAAQAASLVFEDCPGYAALVADATPAQRAYAAYLAGQWDGLDVALLPEQHRAVVGGGALDKIEDPLSRMVAAGALFKAGRMSPQNIELAADTASNQGWRRPLLAWLGVQEQRARAAGDTAAVEGIRRRIALVSGEN